MCSWFISQIIKKLLEYSHMDPIHIYTNIGAAFGTIALPLFKTFAPLFVLMILVKIFEVKTKEREVQYFLRKNKFEFFTLIFTVAGLAVSYFFVDSPNLSFLVGTVAAFIGAVVLIYLKTREKDFFFSSLQDSTHKEDWMGDGTFQYDRVYKGYCITQSTSGFIFSKSLTWSDYVLESEFKILKTSLGVTVRATDLSNLVMLQIFENGIKPHIRVNGFWQWWTPEESGLLFKKKLNLDQWYRGRFYCNKRSVRIKIYNLQNQIVFDRDWQIPTGTVSVKLPQAAGQIAQSIMGHLPFPINLEYGTVGFRNDGEEKAIVKNFLIEKLQGIDSGD